MRFFRYLLNEKAIFPNLSEVKQRIVKIKNELVGKKLPYKRLYLKLSEIFYDLNIVFDISDKISDIRVNRNAKISSGKIDSMTLKITIYLNPDFYLLFESFETFQIFANSLLAVINHELIHREQMLRRNVGERKKIFTHKEKNEKYLSDKNEIMAFSQTIVWDFLLHGIEPNEILDIINHPEYYKDDILIYSSILYSYLDKFEKNSPTIKLLYRYMYEIIEKLKEIKNEKIR